MVFAPPPARTSKAPILELFFAHTPYWGRDSSSMNGVSLFSMVDLDL
jgi:hypothetical protein